MRHAAMLLLAAGALLACDDDPTGPHTERSGFEAGVTPWEPSGLGMEDPRVTWSVEHAPEAFEGSGSARLTLATPAAGPVLWLERTVTLPSDDIGALAVRFRLGTRDTVAGDNWALLVAATADAPPGTLAQFRSPGFIRLAPDQRPFAWLAHEQRFMVPPGATRMHVAIGVQARGPGERSYWLDAVEIELTGVPDIRPLQEDER
ncbi:MAG TPA: hypothetical protein VMK65_13805 [Longimicrobiales bacterium]|nr:hypothetical protein [Longimicrobiales bacterium]